MCISCLFVTFACILAAPAPRPDGPVESEGPLERMYKTMIGFPEAMLSGANIMLSGIPILNMIPGMIRSGINMGESIVRNVDDMERNFFQGDKRSRSNESRPSKKTDKKAPKKSSDDSDDSNETKD